MAVKESLIKDAALPSAEVYGTSKGVRIALGIILPSLALGGALGIPWFTVRVD
jgi:hypothetical protein